MGAWSETQQERRDLAEFLETLTPAQWDTSVRGMVGSPDRDLRVRDVVAHVIQGATESHARAILGIARSRFDYDGYYDRKAREGGAREPEDLLAGLRAAVTSERCLLGLPRPKPMAMLGETFVHHQELRHLFDSPREIPPSRMIMVLDVVKSAGFPLSVKKRISGVRLRATDLDWQWGDGPEILGRGEALFFAMIKKRALLDQLEGDGVAKLTARI